MRDIPDCLSRRYQALDELIKDLTRSGSEAPADGPDTRNDAGIRLLCDFWNILKEDPEYDIVQAVRQKLGLPPQPPEEGRMFRPENVTCYMAGKCCKKDDGDDSRRDPMSKIRKICSSSEDNPKCCASKAGTPSSGSEVLPLSKVLCNLKEAASFDKKCNVRINELMETQKVLKDQIQHLEHREKEGVQLLKEADCMWTCMEDAYNKKITESIERQKILTQQLRELESSTAKWRKNKKDLELQLVSVGKCHEEIKDKINQKNSDLKCMDVEIEDFKKRIENNKKDMDAVKKSFGTKKQASDARIAKIASEISKLEKVVLEEKKYKNNKEQEGSKYVQEARTDLQKICKVLLQKKIENEDLLAQKQALNFEIDVLKQTCDQCKDKCKNRQQELSNEIAKVDKQIKDFKVKCTRCHVCTDTVDMRKFCTDCPRCLKERDCILENDHCTIDRTMDCVCTTVKHKFLDNVFENMYNVLERQVKSGPGKAVAEAVFNCLKRSRNGKLDFETKKILQDFILTVVKKNLNLTIVGGAVKTRCEMDSDTYKQLMLCLQQVTVVKPPKEDKGTPAKKDSCRRWGGPNECNCPKGPKACICLKKAPPPPHDPPPCPPLPEDKEEESVVIKCPHRDTGACGADCAMHGVPSRVGADIAAWRPDPCKEQSCRFSKNMRAAQCMLGPESLVSLPKGYMNTIPQLPDFQDLDELMTCKCGRAPTKPCSCQDRRSHPRARIIEEVLGRYSDMPTIDKVIFEDEFSHAESNRRTHSVQNDVTSGVSKDCAYPSNTTVPNLTLVTNNINSMNQEKNEKNVNKDQLVTLYYNKSSSNEFSKKNKINNEVHPEIAVILHPQFTDASNKKNYNVDDIEMGSRKCNNGDNIGEIYKEQLKNDKNIFGRKLCDTVNDLLKDIIVPSKENNKFNDSEFVWVTVDSLIKDIASLTKIPKENPSNVTVNEVELKMESLGNSNANKHHKAQQDANSSEKNSFSAKDELKIAFCNIKRSEVDKKRITKRNGLLPNTARNKMCQNKIEKQKHQPNYYHKLNSSCVIKCTNSKLNNKRTIQNKTEKATPCLRPSSKISSKSVKKYEHSKQLKAGIIKTCDKVNCKSLWDEMKEKANRSYSLIEKEIGKEIYSEECSVENIKKVPSVLTDILAEARRHFSSDMNLQARPYDNKNVTFDKDTKEIKDDKPTDPLKVVISEDSPPTDQITELKTTESGNLALELDEKVIRLIEEKCAKNPDLFVSLDETDSGNLVINFSPVDDTMDKKRRVSIKKTPSGTRLLEVKKEFANRLKQNKLMNNTINDSTNKEKHTREATCDCRGHASNVPDQNNYLSELHRLCDEGTKYIFIKVIALNGLCKKIKGTIIKSASGNIAIDVTNISSIGEITYKSGICFAFLTKTISDSFSLQICPDNSHYNVILRRSKSGGIIMVPSVLEPIGPIQHAHEARPRNELFRVKIKTSNKLVEAPPAVLKLTPSRNYTVILDKEYEKSIKKTIDNFIEDHSECFVEVDRTNSGTFLVILDDNETYDCCEPNAFLTKSQSGNIKVVMHEPVLENVDSILPKKTYVSSSRAYSQLLNKLPSSNRKIKTDSSKKTTLHDTKSCSDSHLYDKVRMKLSDNKKLLERSATLTRTASGQYAVVLNKESKKAFVNHLKSYLSGSQGMIPIKRTKSGEITITLNYDSESTNCGYGSLKITPSGNIYVTIDEKVIQGMKKDVNCSPGFSLDDELSKHIIGSILSPVNKSVTTTCNAKPEKWTCDESKCVCKELQLDRNGWFKCIAAKDITSYLKCPKPCFELPKVRNDHHDGQKICDPEKCKEPCAGNKSIAKSPHIVIKPCDCKPALPKNPRAEEYCYVVEATCPYHVDQYETGQTELLKNLNLYNNTLETRDLARSISEDKESAVRDRSWDSLNYLPPQLPRFLQDVNFR